MDFNFEGKKALITGAGKGIGRDTAIALWKGGAEVYALSRTKCDLDSLLAECPGMHAILVDLRDWEETQKIVTGIGVMDLLVNNAALLQLNSVMDTSEEAFDILFDVLVKAVVNVTQIIAKGMVAKQSGAIVNISSIGSKAYLDEAYIHCAAKAALDQLTRCQAVELGPYQVRVNSVNPTAVMTPKVMKMKAEKSPLVVDVMNRTPCNRAAQIKDIVNATLYLLSEKADMINGAILPVDGGFWCT